jgi:oligopeptide transport system permease protein
MAIVARLMRGVSRCGLITFERTRPRPVDWSVGQTCVARRRCGRLSPARLPPLGTGWIIVETIFSIPGVGRYFVEAALNRDYTLVMGTVVVIA